MKNIDLASLAEVYRQVVVAGVVARMQEEATSRKRKRGIYAAQVVLWLMMLQRLDGRGTLSNAVRRLVDGELGIALPDCKRVRENRISTATGGYCRARTRLPKAMARSVTSDLVERLRKQLAEPWPGLEAPVYALDGSSLRLRHSRELLKAYPPVDNQHGAGHWPVMRVVVAHEVRTGLAQTPCWGPMSMGEQALADEVMRALPESAVVIADRNFGIFSVVWTAQQQGHPVIVRLTEARAKSLVKPITEPGEWDLEWRPTRWDQQRQCDWPADAALKGRLIAARIGRGQSQSWLYLFTTLDLPAEQIVEIYGERWNVEPDLRALKQTVWREELRANTCDMLEKELLMAVSAYNLVRAVMCLAARKAGIEPRALSYTRTLDLLNAAWHRLTDALTPEQHDLEFDRILTIAATFKLPQRHKQRSFPRAVWSHGSRFPLKKSK